MFMTRSLNPSSRTTEQHLIARSDKSVAYVTNNKRLRSTFCTIEAKLLTDTKHRGFFATAELLIVDCVARTLLPDGPIQSCWQNSVLC